jgi:hypothetical protein
MGQDQAIHRPFQQAGTRDSTHLMGAVQSGQPEQKKATARRRRMSVKALFVLVSALAATSSTVALAQHVDPSPYSQHPEYRSSPADRDYRGVLKSFGASDMPAGFYNEEQH